MGNGASILDCGVAVKCHTFSGQILDGTLRPTTKESLVRVQATKFPIVQPAGTDVALFSFTIGEVRYIALRLQPGWDEETNSKYVQKIVPHRQKAFGVSATDCFLLQNVKKQQYFAVTIYADEAASLPWLDMPRNLLSVNQALWETCESSMPSGPSVAKGVVLPVADTRAQCWVDLQAAEERASKLSNRGNNVAANDILFDALKLFSSANGLQAFSHLKEVPVLAMTILESSPCHEDMLQFASFLRLHSSVLFNLGFYKAARVLAETSSNFPQPPVNTGEVLPIVEELLKQCEIMDIAASAQRLRKIRCIVLCSPNMSGSGALWKQLSATCASHKLKPLVLKYDQHNSHQTSSQSPAKNPTTISGHLAWGIRSALEHLKSADALNQILVLGVEGEPSHVVDRFFSDVFLVSHFELDGVIVVLDARKTPFPMKVPSLVANHLCFADRVVVCQSKNLSELRGEKPQLPNGAEEEGMAHVEFEVELRSLNLTASVMFAESAIDATTVESLLERPMQSFCLSLKAETYENLLSAQPCSHETNQCGNSSLVTLAAPDCPQLFRGGHTSLEQGLRGLIDRLGERLYRSRGVVVLCEDAGNVSMVLFTTLHFHVFFEHRLADQESINLLKAEGLLEKESRQNFDERSEPFARMVFVGRDISKQSILDGLATADVPGKIGHC